MLSEKMLNILTENTFFIGILREKLSTLDEDFFEEFHYNKGEIIIKEDTIPQEMYLIVSGEVRITKISPDGKEIEVARSRGGQFIGDLSLIEDKKRSANVIAASPVMAIIIRKEQFFSILDRIPQIKNNIAKSIADKLRALNTKTSFEVEKSMNLFELNQKIIAQKQELEELNATKDRFFMIIAHDLKNPLATLIGYADILTKMFDKLSQDEVKKGVQAIDRASKSLNQLLENLLEWARTQTGRMDFDPEEINLFLMATNNISVLYSVAESKNIKLTYDVEEDTMVIGDKHMLNTVIRNLMSNAIKFTKSGGEVKISTEEKNSFVEVSISDTGIGISPEDKEKLFRIDVHHTTPGTSREKGTGLGLIICKEFIEKHGGKIWIESEIGEGSIFKFTIPKANIE